MAAERESQLFWERAAARIKPALLVLRRVGTQEVSWNKRAFWLVEENIRKTQKNGSI